MFGEAFLRLCQLAVSSHNVELRLAISVQCAFVALKDTTHALWSCQESIEVWRSTSLWTILNSLPGGPFNALCMFLAAKGSLTDLNIFCTIAWCL